MTALANALIQLLLSCPSFYFREPTLFTCVTFVDCASHVDMSKRNKNFRDEQVDKTGELKRQERVVLVGGSLSEACSVGMN